MAEREPPIDTTIGKKYMEYIKPKPKKKTEKVKQE